MRDLKILTRKLRRVFRPSHHDDPIVLQDRYRSALTHVAEFFERIDEENIANQFLDLADAMEGRACARSPRSSASIPARCSGLAALSTQARPPCEEAEVKETWQLVELHGR